MMACLRIKPKHLDSQLTPAQLAKLKAEARSRAANSLLIEMAPDPGCDHAVLWIDLSETDDKTAENQF
jgi:hypothetical protein